MPSNLSSLLIATGRVGLASLFILGGINKIFNYQETLQSMTEVGLNPAALLLPLVITLELGGGVVVASGRWKAAWVALILAVFTLATNIFFHDFWTMDGKRAALEVSLFFKNIAIAGALLFYAGALKARAS